MAEYFASADLNEDDEMRPLEFSLDGPIAPGPYSSTVQNIFSRQCSEIRTASESLIAPIHTVSRKRLKEIVTKQNNELFKFLQRPDRTPHPNGIAEAIFRRYGHDIPSLHRNTQPISRDLNLDCSMEKTIHDLNEQLAKHGGSTAENLTLQLKWVFTQYKNLGEEILRIETILAQKIEVLDKLHQRIPIISSLSSNDALSDLMDSFSKYLEKAFQDSKFEETYYSLVEHYKKWAYMREIISLQQALSDSSSSEPTCSICLVDGVSHVIVPCGHTFCTGCSRKMNLTCYICRGTIREKIKLFFN